MANKNGWWTFCTNVELTDFDLEYIANLIRQGYRSGEVCKDEEDEENEEGVRK